MVAQQAPVELPVEIEGVRGPANPPVAQGAQQGVASEGLETALPGQQPLAEPASEASEVAGFDDEALEWLRSDEGQQYLKSQGFANEETVRLLHQATNQLNQRAQSRLSEAEQSAMDSYGLSVNAGLINQELIQFFRDEFSRLSEQYGEEIGFDEDALRTRLTAKLSEGQQALTAERQRIDEEVNAEITSLAATARPLTYHNGQVVVPFDHPNLVPLWNALADNLRRARNPVFSQDVQNQAKQQASATQSVILENITRMRDQALAAGRQPAPSPAAQAPPPGRSMQVLPQGESAGTTGRDFKTVFDQLIVQNGGMDQVRKQGNLYRQLQAQAWTIVDS